VVDNVAPVSPDDFWLSDLLAITNLEANPSFAAWHAGWSHFGSPHLRLYCCYYDGSSEIGRLGDVSTRLLEFSCLDRLDYEPASEFVDAIWAESSGIHNSNSNKQL
jgi:hypothetical protein